MDFDDLLLKTNELLNVFPDVLAKYQDRFKYILVDEYQDTNHSQYLIVRALSDRFQNICVVGDDAQSIYAFRGANINNILNFQKDYDNVKTYRLEQNYRSTKNIVEAANSIIDKNQTKLEKVVWTANDFGPKVKVHRSITDSEEGRFVASEIFEQKMRNQMLNGQFAVLYRTNAQSRSIEDALRKRDIPYRIYGGLSFYQRKEIKDVLCYKDHGLQAGSAILDGFVSQFTATAVQRILDEDAIIIGRQNCDEFAMGSSNENSAFGVVRNAADISRVPGGSSGGSAVAVQADMCLASLGSDTGGSVRQPAAFCGLVGLKPTYGRVSRWGLIAYGSSFDCIGPITKCVEDAALLLEIMAGADEFDSTVSRQPVPAYSSLTEANTSSHLRIGYLREGVESEALQPEIKLAMQAKLDWLREQGHTVEAVDFDLLPYILPTYYILTTAESSSNLSRYDGVRYGHRSRGFDVFI
jgi:hypothetical protein